MNFEELVHLLKEKVTLIEVMISDSQEINDICLLHQHLNHWNEDVLYVGNLSDIENKPSKSIHLLTTQKPTHTIKLRNYAIVKESELFQAINLCKEFLLNDTKIHKELYKLSQLALKEKSINYIINYAAQLVGNALIFVDSNHQVISYSTIFEIMDPLWVKNIEQGYYSDEFIQKITTNQGIREWTKQGEETKIITLPGDKQQKLVSRITQNDQLFGAVVMIEHHRPINKAHYELLPKIGEILYHSLNCQVNDEEVHETFYRTLLYNLLDDTYTLETANFIDAKNIQFSNPLHIVVAQYSRLMENRYLMHRIRLALEQIFSIGHSVLYENHVVILVPKLGLEQKKALMKLSQKEQIDIGISWPFSEIKHLKKYFNQAVHTIQLARKLNLTSHVSYYSHYSFYHLIKNYKEGIPLADFTHPALKVLREYDQENKTEYYVTLRSFLECDKNLQQAANKLFIHKNTLVYRINRIKKIIDMDLTQPEETYSLMDSFRIETFLHINE